MSEEDTKARYISPAIRDSGWYDGKNVKMEFPDKNPIHKPYHYTDGRIESYTGKRGKQKGRRLDYLLYTPDIYHKIGVIEAKDVYRAADYGLQQGEDYAKDLNIPFVFASNGKKFVFEDMVTGANKDIPLDAFPTPKELKQRYYQDKGYNQSTISKITAINHSPYFYGSSSDSKTPRYYQVNAVNKTLEAIAKGKRHIMFVMATGTGKTYTAFQIAWRLTHAKLHRPIRNVLYLVDRTVLANQPKNNEFSSFSTIQLNRHTLESWSKYKNTVDVYFGLYQSLFAQNKAQDKKFMYEDIDRHFFDLIIIDEAHRASAREESNWRQILNYFSPVDKGQTKSNTIIIGMTATPNNKKDANPEFFGKPVYNYSLKQGINDGFLAPYNVVHINTNLDKNGFVPKEHERDANGREIPLRRYIGTDFYRTIDLKSQTKSTAHILTAYLKKHHVRDAKTIIFCVSQAHAREMDRALKNENQDLVSMYNKIGKDYVAQITSDADNAQLKLEQFENNNTKTPTLVTTSDMLRTGVNAPDIKMIVLDVNVQSSIEFRQMIGRGTRLDTRNGKTSFTIMDFGNNIHNFHNDKFDGKPDKDNTIDKTKAKQMDKDTKDDYVRPSKKAKKPIEHQKKHMYVVNRHLKVNVTDAQVYQLDKNGKVIPNSLLRYSKNNIVSVFHNPKIFRNKWQKATWKSKLIDELQKHQALLNVIRKRYPKLQKYDYFDMIVHLAYGQKPLTKQERVNHVKKQGVLYEYKGAMREILTELLNEYQNKPDFNVNSLENPNSLQSPAMNKFGGIVNIIEDFNGTNNYKKAIHNIINALYSRN